MESVEKNGFEKNQRLQEVENFQEKGTALAAPWENGAHFEKMN